MQNLQKESVLIFGFLTVHLLSKGIIYSGFQKWIHLKSIII